MCYQKPNPQQGVFWRIRCHFKLNLLHALLKTKLKKNALKTQLLACNLSASLSARMDVCVCHVIDVCICCTIFIVTVPIVSF